MKIHLPIEIQIAIGVVLVVLVLALLAWMIFRHKPTADELERKRRGYLADERADCGWDAAGLLRDGN